MFRVVHKGNFEKTKKFLNTPPSKILQSRLNSWGEQGVSALRSATPRDTGNTSESWGYKIISTPVSTSIVWTNSQDAGGAPLAVLLQYGHGTNNGGYVEGIDYINPAIKPVFDNIAKEAWSMLSKS